MAYTATVKSVNLPLLKVTITLVDEDGSRDVVADILRDKTGTKNHALFFSDKGMNFALTRADLPPGFFINDTLDMTNLIGGTGYFNDPNNA